MQTILDVFGWQNWVLSSFASTSITKYKGRAPTEIAVESKTVRKDVQWNVGTSLQVPLTDKFSLNVEFQHTENDSNLDRYKFTNQQVMIGPSARF